MKSAAVDEERIEREHDQAAEKLAEEVAEIARKFADEAAKVTRKRVSPRLPSIRAGAARGDRSGGPGDMHPVRSPAPVDARS